MIKNYLSKALLSLFSIAAIGNVSAQNQNGKMCVEANVGLREYLGDLGSSLFFGKKPNYQGGGINFGYQLSPLFDGVVNATFGDVGFKRITEWRAGPGKFQSFRANTADFTLGARFRFNNDIIMPIESKVAPYIYAGFGGYYCHTSVRWGEQNEISRNLTDFGTQVQGGLGVSFNLSDNIGLRWSWTGTYTFNDRWDGANNPASADPIATPLVNKVWKTNDLWGYHAIGITYIFGEGQGPTKCKDKDLDGVCDKFDLCKGTPEKYQKYVDSVGCPADRDKDSVLDADDACPDVKGLVKYSGCPDTDGDDIEDKLDKCPNLAGLPEFNGCPDTDGDGIQDTEDNCPNVAGLKEFNGCPDTDGDGIEDRLDKCINKAGVVAGEGCPDTDGDGVYDNIDVCPDKPGVAELKGCPAFKKEVVAQIALAAKGINFETNSDVIKAESFDDLDNLVKLLNQYAEAKVEVQGHTDNSGDKDVAKRKIKNQDLSQRRAESVKKYLESHGVSPERLTAVGYGEEQPIADNNSAAGKTKNRRVDFKLKY